eukprot:48743-Eustigmatos_ZCMA.PRE.1
MEGKDGLAFAARLTTACLELLLFRAEPLDQHGIDDILDFERQRGATVRCEPTNLRLQAAVVQVQGIRQIYFPSVLQD